MLNVFIFVCFVRGAPDKAHIESIERQLETARTDLLIPGCALAVVMDNQVVLLRGFGQRDVENKLPVTPDTRFAIGSCTKAFTGMLAAMSVDAGKLSFDDSPKKFLPWFKLFSDEIDSKITLRDMLCHRSGYGSADLLWYSGTLSREEVIRGLAHAMPTAKLREKWQYQNIMYSAAGEAIAAANGSTWEKLIEERIFAPLGMNNSDTSVTAMQKSADFSRAYDYGMETKKSRLVPTRDLTNIAPAGAINSSARDMAQWVRFMLNRGHVNGKPLVSETSFNETITKQFEMAPKTGYAMGWGISDHNGHTVLSHAGGIDGFNAHVAFIPDLKIGYVLLTNVSRSTLDARVQSVLFGQLVEKPATRPADASRPATMPAEDAGQPRDPKSEVGKYGMIEVVWKNDSLYAIVPGQPNYKLAHVAGRRYKFADAPGFFVTFRETENGRPEIWLEQPHGNHALAKDSSPKQEANDLVKFDGPMKELLGTWSTSGFSMRVAVRDGKVVAIVPGQPTYTLTPTNETDAYSIPPAPSPAYELRFRRDDAGKISSLLVKQPHGDMELTRATPTTSKAGVNIDELLAKIVEAAGGEANLRKHRTLTMKCLVDFENQGITAWQTVYMQAPDRARRTTTLRAFESTREIGTIDEYFDGAGGGATGSFFSTEPMEGPDAIAAARIEANFHGPAEWRKLFAKITVKGEEKVEDEPVYVLSLEPESGSPVTVYVSKSSHRILRRDLTHAPGVGAGQPISETYSEFRDVQGVILPHRIEQKSASSGRAIIFVDEAHFDEPIEPDTFRFPGKS